jgi:hypothetical protein
MASSIEGGIGEVKSVSRLGKSVASSNKDKSASGFAGSA